MTWNVEYLPEAVKDLRDLDGSQRQLVAKAIAKVSKNPLPDVEGGYGKPLTNKGGNNLSGFLKIKLKASDLRIVYQLVKVEGEMLLFFIGARADEEVYNLAQKRIVKHDL